jgi:hypothetical protein
MRYLSMVFGLALVVIVGGILAVVAISPTGTLPAGQVANPAGLPTAGASLPPSLPPVPAPELTPELPGATRGEQPAQTTGSEPSPAPPTEPSSAPPTEPAPEPLEPSPDATPDASPGVPLPTATPAAPSREVTFSGVGLDSAGTDAEEPTTPRYFTFTAEGPGTIRVQLSSATGRVRACIWRGEPQAMVDETCRTFRRGVLERPIEAGPAQSWTVALIGSQVSGSPSTTVRLSFPTNDARLRLAGFRFQGQEIENYNGFSAEVRAASAGQMSVSARFDDGEGGTHPYRLVIQAIGGGPSQPFIAEHEGSSLSEVTQLQAERGYLVTLDNREQLSESAVMLWAELAWP